LPQGLDSLVGGTQNKGKSLRPFNGVPGVVPRYVPAINKNELQKHLLFRLKAIFLASKRRL